MHRRELGHGAHPGSKLWAADSNISKAALCSDVESHCEGQVRHSRRPLHQRIGYTSLKFIRHTLGVG